MEREHYAIKTRSNHLISTAPLFKQVIKDDDGIEDDILVPSIPNTGIYKPIPVKTYSLPAPVTASSPTVLRPNESGGMASTSPVGELNKLVTASKAGLQGMINKAGPSAPILIEPTTKQIASASASSVDPLQAGGFKLPTMGIMLAMIAGVILLYFISKKKS